MGQIQLALATVRLAVAAVRIKQRTAHAQVRRYFIKAVHRQEFQETEQQLVKVLVPLFKFQIDDVVRRLNGMGGSQVGSPAKLARRVFDPDDWHDKLVGKVLPVLARAMGKAAVNQLNVLRTQKPKKSTASEWLEEEGEDLPPGLSVDLPQWMQDAIQVELQDAFAQPYWTKISQTTLGDVEGILTRGLQEGYSIREMAAEIKKSLGYEYYKGRATNIARTESGNALNASRDLSIQQLKEEMGDAGKYLGKSWLSVLSSTTRGDHADLDGVLANKNGNFNLNGILIPWPGHVSLPPSDRCNCMCSIVTELGVGAPEEEIQALLEG